MADIVFYKSNCDYYYVNSTGTGTQVNTTNSNCIRNSPTINSWVRTIGFTTGNYNVTNLYVYHVDCNSVTNYSSSTKAYAGISSSLISWANSNTVPAVTWTASDRLRYLQSSDGYNGYYCNIECDLKPDTTYYLYFWVSTSGGAWDVLTYPYTGSGSTTRSTRTELTFQTKNIPEYTQTYIPNGAAAGSNYTATSKKHGTDYTLRSSMPSGWSKKATATSSIAVTLNGNGGTNSSKSVTKTTTYSLGAWLKENSSSSQYALGGTYKENADANWYPKWSSSVSYNSITLGTASRSNGTSTGYTVSFDTNGSTTTRDSITATDTITYTFKNWNTSKDGSGTSYSSTASYTTTSASTVYAQWTSATTKGSITLPAKVTKSNSTTNYTTKFYTNYGNNTYTSASSSKTVTYAFKGWGTSTSASTIYLAGDSYTPSKSLTLYANWTSTTTYSSITFPTLTRTGYKLLGWSTSASATTATYAAGATINPTSSVTYYAVWEATSTMYIYHDGAWRRALKYVWDTSSITETTTSNLLDEGVLDEIIIS